jgi:hypothetical protein
MKPMDLYRCAVAELGNVSAAELSEHLQQKHGVAIDPACIPIFKATLQNLTKLKKATLEANPIASIQPAEAP